jgi:glycosyltransferase involved in cell wall biosynthesis
MAEIDASILLVAGDAAVLRAQLDALAAARLTERHELVVISDGEIAAPGGLAARFVHARRGDLGRQAALARAASAARGEVCIALAQVARPEAGFVDPLVAAVHAGAGLAAPVLETCGGDVHGYRALPDGSLWPLRERDGEPDALALDCLAAVREFWISGLPELDAVEGHYELHVARAAGSLAVVAGARCRRRTIGPRATVIVCTQDRPDEIIACSEALLEAGADEILVVDNGSGAPLGLPDGVRLVREPVPGLSRARNTGAAGATHDVLVFLDDDARPAPGWLEHLRDAFADETVMVAGGPIHGLWPPERPPGWPQAPWTSYLSILSHGDADRTWPRGDFYGANWAVRRSALDEVGGFEHRWGASADGLLAGEETAVEQLIAACGIGVARYAAGAAVGHRIDPARCDEGWLALRVYRHGLAIPWIEAGFVEPPRELAERLARTALERIAELVRLEGTVDPDQALALCTNAPLPLDRRLEAARTLGTAVGALAVLGVPQVGIGAAVLEAPARHARGFTAKPRVRRSGAALRALAIVPAFNEEDVIEHVVADLVANGLEVVLLDNESTDRTVELARRAGADVETFTSEGFALRGQLTRFQEIAAARDHDWALVCDADEFRESPWPGLTLLEALREVDALGYSAVNFEVFNFRPTDDGFVPGTDVREHLTRYEPPELFDVIQLKCWQNPGCRVDLSELFGEGARFPNRRVFPVPFILRHYPIRGETHGRRKVLAERLPRYDAAERGDGWHVQYDAFAGGETSFLWDPAALREWDGGAVRAELLARGSHEVLRAQVVRGFEAERTGLDVGALGAWLGRTLGRAAVTPEEAEAAIRIAGSLPREVDPGAVPYLVAATRLLAGEARLNGRPFAARELDEAGTRLARPRLTAVAFADELIEHPELLDAYGRSVSGSDPLTLAIVGDDIAGLQGAVARAGLDADATADLLAVGSDPPRAEAVYSHRDFADLPRFDESSVDELRALALRRAA